MRSRRPSGSATRKPTRPKTSKGSTRSAKARLVGVSPNAIDLGITLPLDVVRRFNAEYHSPQAAAQYSSLLVRVHDAPEVANVISAGAAEGLIPG